MNIEAVEGIGPENAAALRGAGVTTTEALLERGATAAGRAELAAAAGVSPKLLLEWVNHVDLMRIDGVGSEYSDLLEAAGVDSPAELAQRNAANLAQTFQELDAARPNWIRSIPSQETVEGWIAQAKTLPKIVSHGGGAADDGGDGGAATDAGPALAAMDTADDAVESPVPAAAFASASAAPVSSARAAPAATVATAAPTASTSVDGGGTGLWARIKRLLGG